MRYLIHLAIGLFGLCIFPGLLKAQNLYVLENSGEQDSFVINEIGKLHFSMGTLIVEMQSGTSEYYPLADIRYLNFANLVQVENVPLDNSDVSLYPNPVKESLYITYYLPGADVVRLEIVSSDGRLVYRETIRKAESVMTWKADVSTIPQGLYVCCLRSEKNMITKKFIKN